MINNSAYFSYNNTVEEITITQNGFPSRYMSYLYGKVQDRFSFLPATCNLKRDGNCEQIAFITERAYCPYVRKFTEEHIADVITVGYKYEFFKTRLALPLLSPKKKRLLLTAIVAADYQEDRAHALKRVCSNGEYCIDGVYHFRLKRLKERWQEIVEYIPADMNERSLDGFLEFLTEDGENTIYLKDGKAYDQEYRPLSKSMLTGEASLVGEILLGNAEKVYCFGETDRETTSFLKKYYAGKATFC